MASPLIQTSFVSGEVSPALFGNVDLVRMHAAASTMRNMWASYRGGAYSRAGTAMVGFSKQTGRSFPPRLIPFQFSINQGLALEFGNFYMRVIFDGGFVTEAPYIITGATRANPCVLTISPTSTLVSVVPINSAVSASYAPGDTVSLAGGSFTTRAAVTVKNTSLATVAVNGHGNLYFPNDFITITGGGSAIINPVLQVTRTRVVGFNPVPLALGSGGTPGAAVLTGTTGVGTKWQANVTINSFGQLQSINSIASPGSYSGNPSTSAGGINSDSMSGGGFTNNPIIGIATGVDAIFVINRGQFFANGSGSFTQLSSTGSGSGATFSGGIFGVYNASVTTPGNYSALPSNPVSQSSTSGGGAGVTFTATWQSSPALSTGDWIFVDDIVGMTQLNGRTFIAAVSGSSLSLFDVYGSPIDSTAYTAYVSGGLAARIFTLATQYSEVDLPYLKVTESADVMSLCCVNQQTGTEYPPVDLSRSSDTSWTFTPAVPTPTVFPPTILGLSFSSQPAAFTTWASYQYVVTSVAADGTESVASNIGSVTDVVDIQATTGTIVLGWAPVPGVTEYFIYKATPGVSATSGSSADFVIAGCLFGYAGSSFGVKFIDTNIVPDFTQVPPLHDNPFARGKILNVTPGATGSGYTSEPTVTINTFTGSGAIIQALHNDGVPSYIVKDGGVNYATTDTITVSGGGGSGATGTLVVGPQTGTYPGVVAYFQQRRFYAYTLNQPDTYFASQPGAFNNFDHRTPTIDSDAFTGNPWSVQVNGVQFMIPTTGGLVVLTGLEAYFLTGNGGSAFSPQPVTPSSQSALPQGFNGCSATVPPIRIYQDVLYVQAKGSKYRDFSFNINLNTYTGEDITENSAHLFDNYTIREHAWCEEPYRLLWAVRNDGILLSLTWVKSEKVEGWCRHDTFGTFQSVCSVTEPPVDALYLATQRQIGVHTAYVIERMNDRLWGTAEDVWCVDCALTYGQATPAATLTASSATGLGSLTGVTGLVGGAGYSSATTATVVDDSGAGPGSGAVVALTIVAGIITAVAFTSQGSGYVNPQLVINDPAGSAGGAGALATIVLNNSATFTANASVFVLGSVGSVIRMGGGVATITAFTSGTVVTANITTPIATLIPNGTNQPQPAASGNWTLSVPVTTVGGLYSLVGATVSGVADGVAITPQVVSATGTITLAQPASQIVIGMPFLPQLQSVYLLTEELQGQRKKVAEVTARVQSSGPFEIGSNQPDGSVQSPALIAPLWQNMAVAPTPAVKSYNSPTTPLYTGDIRIPVQGGYQKPGQVAVQQPNPYPLEVLAFVPEVLLGDHPSQTGKSQQDKYFESAAKAKK